MVNLEGNIKFLFWNFVWERVQILHQSANIWPFSFSTGKKGDSQTNFFHLSNTDGWKMRVGSVPWKILKQINKSRYIFYRHQYTQ